MHPTSHNLLTREQAPQTTPQGLLIQLHIINSYRERKVCVANVLITICLVQTKKMICYLPYCGGGYVSVPSMNALMEVLQSLWEHMNPKASAFPGRLEREKPHTRPSKVAAIFALPISENVTESYSVPCILLYSVQHKTLLNK